MPVIFSHARIVLDIVSMKVFVWVLRQLFTSAVDPNGGILDSHLFFYARYSDLAEYHRLRGRTTKADTLAAIAEACYQVAPDDDDEPEAAAMAMPVPRPPIRTNAVSTTRVPKPREDEPSGLAPSPAH
ncbi:MAG TPA: hypothetical protein VFT47_16550 [Vicinamibacterales bacterium]|nr:hypothetical protein [Vicinamibacterales bacterium]